MLDRGEILVERLTGKRAMVIHVAGPDEVTCRFSDGRLEDRYTFELEPTPSLLRSLLVLVMAPFVARPSERVTTRVGERVRPLSVPQRTSS